MSIIENLWWRYAAKSFGGGMVSQENLDLILEATRLSASSFGTQPYRITIVSNKLKLEELKKYADGNERKFETGSHILIFSYRTDAYARFMGIKNLKNMPGNFLRNTGFVFQYFLPIVSFFKMGRFVTKNIWARNQTYLALGTALAACAELKVDSCPMEGFNARKFSKILNLPKNIKPVALLAIGTRDENDSALKYPKVRFPKEDLFDFQ